MRIIRRKYKSASKQYGITAWTTQGYLAFDLYFGRTILVLGFRTWKS